MAWFNPFSWFQGSGNTQRAGSQNPGPDQRRETAAPVTFDTALTVSAFWASTRVLTETVSAMPIKCYRNNEDGSRSEDRNYPLWRLLNFQPNRHQTRIEFFETLMLNLVTNGNCYARVIKAGSRIVALSPLMSQQMDVIIGLDGSKIYRYRNIDGTHTPTIAPAKYGTPNFLVMALLVWGR